MVKFPKKNVAFVKISPLKVSFFLKINFRFFYQFLLKLVIKLMKYVNYVSKIWFHIKVHQDIKKDMRIKKCLKSPEKRTQTYWPSFSDQQGYFSMSRLLAIYFWTDDFREDRSGITFKTAFPPIQFWKIKLSEKNSLKNMAGYKCDLENKTSNGTSSSKKPRGFMRR